MTVEEYKNNYEKFKNERIGKYDDFDQQYGFQCFDLVNRYNYYVLNMGWTLNPLYNYFNLQGKFKEVSVNNMLPGDICIWQGEHICIFDSWKENKLWYLSQDSSTVGTSRRATGVYWNVTNSIRPMRAFRPLYVEDTPKPITLPTKHTVVKDDTVASICRKYYGVAEQKYFDLIKQANGLNDKFLIVIGQVLNIPIYKEEVKPIEPPKEEKPIEEPPIENNDTDDHSSDKEDKPNNDTENEQTIGSDTDNQEIEAHPNLFVEIFKIIVKFLKEMFKK